MVSNDLIKSVDKWSNSFLRPHIPPKLLSNSQIVSSEDDGAKLIYLKFLYGIRTGRLSERPTDGGVSNIINGFENESLWIYSLRDEDIPDGFKALKRKDSGIIGTGDIRKCRTCRGQGKVRCKECGGKVRWTSKDFEGNRVENVCSCGDGKQLCKSCDGFGDVEVIILTQREFKLFQTKNSQYNGEVPENKIKKITGDLIYEQVYDYPIDEMRKMLVGGIDSEEFQILNDAVLHTLKQSIEVQLSNRGDIDISKVQNQLDSLFESLPNPGKENKVLEHEAMPIRVMVRVENAPVKQIDYKYKDKNYSLWVYGKENSVWKQNGPLSFNYKGIILLSLLLILIVFSVFNNVDFRNHGTKNNFNPAKVQKSNSTTNNLKSTNVSNENSTKNSFTSSNLLGGWKVSKKDGGEYYFNSNYSGFFKPNNKNPITFKWSFENKELLRIIIDNDNSVWNWRIEELSVDRIVMFNQERNDRRIIFRDKDKSVNKSNNTKNSFSAVINDPDGYTNVREGKGTNYKVIYRLKENETFNVFLNSENWWKVKLKNGNTGFIYFDRVQLLANNLDGKYPAASLTVLPRNYINNSSKRELKIMRNEIFARHGYIFRKGGEMDRYFRKKNWYKPRYKDVNSKITPIEKANIKLIQSIENSLG